MEQKVTKTPEWSNDLAHFHVEELEERLENRWSATKTCVISYTLSDGQMKNQVLQVIPRTQSCPGVRITIETSGAEIWGDPIEIE